MISTNTRMLLFSMSVLAFCTVRTLAAWGSIGRISIVGSKDARICYIKDKPKHTSDPNPNAIQKLIDFGYTCTSDESEGFWMKCTNPKDEDDLTRFDKSLPCVLVPIFMGEFVGKDKDGYIGGDECDLADAFVQIDQLTHEGLNCTDPEKTGQGKFWKNCLNPNYSGEKFMDLARKYCENKPV